MTERPLIIVETERLVLRYQTAPDIAPLVALWSDPEATRHLGGPRDRAWLESVFEETAQDPYAEEYDLWPVMEKATGAVVGHCGLLEKDVEGNREIELTYVFAPLAWGKGYATEMGRALKRHAFEERGIERVIALIEPGNRVSERVAIKIGMAFEREVVRPGGAVRRMYAAPRRVPGPAQDVEEPLTPPGSPRSFEV